MLRVGLGVDVHRLKEGRPCIIGGVRHESKLGLEGHSDADVLAHAVADAVLGAMRAGDIGTLFPDSDIRYKDANSIELLRSVAELARRRSFTIIDCDCVVEAQTPRLSPARDAMRAQLADALGVSIDQVGIKATTTEHLGFVGREEGIRATAVVVMDGRSDNARV